jgi:ketosteroid isomerase-like protein
LAIFGDTVITTGDFEGEGMDASGKSFVVHERFTHTWVKMPSGQWQCAAIYTSPITMLLGKFNNYDDFFNTFRRGTTL